MRTGRITAYLIRLWLLSSALARAQEDSDAQRIADHVTANHVLVNQGVLDGFGYVSVRPKATPRIFHGALARPRAGDAQRHSRVQREFAAFQPAGSGDRQRVLHPWRDLSRAARRDRGGAQPRAHGHPVLGHRHAPQTRHPHRLFLGIDPVRVFEIRDVDGPEDDMLANTPKEGAASAHTLRSRAAMLMRGHGMVVTADGLPCVIFRAIYTVVNAEVEQNALALGAPVFLNAKEIHCADRVERHWQAWSREAKVHALAH